MKNSSDSIGNRTRDLPPKELLNAIKVHINPKKAPGYITGEILKRLPKKSHSQTNTSVQCRIPTEICTLLLESSGSGYDPETRKACY
jgi:hypothetical protein